MIPKVIYICYKDLEILKIYSQKWKELNPEYKIKLFNHQMCEKFLLKKFSKLHYNLYNFLKDGPIKADFWRLCIIYKYGGLYVDADIEPFVPLREYIQEDIYMATCISFYKRLSPHFIMAEAKNEILKKAINKYLEMFINKKPYKYYDWSINNIMKIDNFSGSDSGFYIIDGKKYQILKEMIASKYEDYYCVFKDVKVLNSRQPNYDYIKHEFINLLN